MACVVKGFHEILKDCCRSKSHHAFFLQMNQLSAFSFPKLHIVSSHSEKKNLYTHTQCVVYISLVSVEHHKKTSVVLSLTGLSKCKY